MPQVVFRRGKAKDLETHEKVDGTLYFTVDDGKIHLDYTDENDELKTKTFYSGKLKIGSHEYDGSEDVEISAYDGTIN